MAVAQFEDAASVAFSAAPTINVAPGSFAVRIQSTVSRALTTPTALKAASATMDFTSTKQTCFTISRM